MGDCIGLRRGAQILGDVKTDAFNDQASPNDAPATGGTLTVALTYEPRALDAILDLNPATDPLCDLFEDTLIDLDPATGGYRMRLAEKMTVEDLLVKSDGMQLTGKLTDTPTGVTMAGAVSGATVTLKTADAALPLVSVARTVIVVLPAAAIGRMVSEVPLRVAAAMPCACRDGSGPVP